MRKLVLVLSAIAILAIPAISFAQITVSEPAKEVWKISSVSCDFGEIIRGLSLKTRKIVLYNYNGLEDAGYDLVTSATGDFRSLEIKFEDCRINLAKLSEIRHMDTSVVNYELEFDNFYTYVVLTEDNVIINLAVIVRLDTRSMSAELKELLFRNRVPLAGAGTMYFITYGSDGVAMPQSPDKIGRMEITIVPEVIRVNGDTWTFPNK